MNKRKVPKIRFKGFHDDWEQRKVGDYYDFKNGLNKGKEFFGEGTPIVNFTDVFHNRGIFPEMLSGKVRLELPEIKNYEVKKGDIFFTRTSETIEEIGYPSVMLGEPKNTVFSGFVLRGRCFLKDEPLDNLFKKYLFFTDAFRTEMLRKSSMTTRALTSGTAIKNMEFLHPSSKEEQHRIGEFLTKLDNLITLHQRKLEKLKIIKKSMLENCFPKNGEKAPKIRFSGFSDDWEQRKLDEFVSFFNGLTYSPKDIQSTGTLVLRSSNVKDGEVVDADNVYVDPAVVDSENVRDGDIIVVVRNGSRALIGKHAEIKGSKPHTVIGAFMTGIRSEHPSFLNALLNTPHFDKEVEMNMGATINQITGYMFSKMEFMVPSPEEQDAIGEFFKQLDQLITLHQSKLEKMKMIKKSMLETMFV